MKNLDTTSKCIDLEGIDPPAGKIPPPEWIDILEMNELQSEYGCKEQINWLSQDNITVYDENNNIVMCKCGEKATGSVIGINCSVHYCNKCMFGEKEDG